MQAIAKPQQRVTMVSRKLLLAAVLALAGSLSAYADVQVVSKVQPEFPKEALQAGVDKGHVKARMTLDSTGEVTRVEIVEANPRRVFDRTVMRTLAMWRYNAGEPNRAVEIDVEFKR
jgi:periplasmic protein TonB